MGIFDDREKAQENKYFHDAELKFKAIARRNKLFGLWAADRLGLKGEAAEAYALEIVKVDFELPDDSDVLGKVGGDLKAKNLSVGEAELKERLQACLADAIKQLEAETK